MSGVRRESERAGRNYTGRGEERVGEAVRGVRPEWHRVRLGERAEWGGRHRTECIVCAEEGQTVGSEFGVTQ